MNAPDGVLVVLSGGLDSAVLLAESTKHYSRVAAITFDYGQRHKVEVAHARALASHFGVTLHDVVSLRLDDLLRANALTGRVDVPDGHYEAESMRATVVPNRNAIMLNIAAAKAADAGYNRVVTAIHAGDHAIYPDCRPHFILALNAMLLVALDGVAEVQIVAPFVAMSKTQIVARGAQLSVPFDKTWSCYKGFAMHCGTCGTCVERREAFRDAGVSDPTYYQTDLDAQIIAQEQRR
jgi:7-cyano-7-deazaguanine synthase